MLLAIIAPIMAGFMIFFAFYAGTGASESILEEEENHTLPRLFTTPTPQSTILSGKFLAVFLVVLMQVIVLMISAHLIFGIQWGETSSVILVAMGIVFAAASCGIFINSFIKDTHQGGLIYGGILTLSGMLGMIRVFGMGTASTENMVNNVSLLVPQGWAVRGLLQTMNGAPIQDVLVTFLVLLLWAAVFFGVGVWRFNHRYG